jgi:hypothetical protein
MGNPKMRRITSGLAGELEGELLIEIEQDVTT